MINTEELTPAQIEGIKQHDLERSILCKKVLKDALDRQIEAKNLNQKRNKVNLKYGTRN